MSDEEQSVELTAKQLKSRHANDEVSSDVEGAAKLAATRAKKKVRAASTGSSRGATMTDLLEAAREGKDVDFSLLAKRLVEKRQDDDAAAMEKARAIEPALRPMFYKCRACEGPAIFFTKNPIGAGSLDASSWFATYKKPSEPWPNELIPCQSCLARTQIPFGIGVVWVPDPSGWGKVSFRLDSAGMRRVYTVDPETGEETPAMMTKTRKISADDIAREEAEVARG